MKYLIVVHRHRLRHWNYDILYKPSLLDRLRGREPNDWGCQYETCCPYAMRYEMRGWKYLCSGDTAHIESVLKDMGLRDEYDLEGLLRWLKRLYPGATIVVEEV